MKTPKKPLVFISHLNTERDVAIALKDQIDKCFLGLYEVFVSSDEQTINMGDRWIDKISDALRNCVVEIVICSPQSITRQWINFEAGAGWVRGIPVIPICHSGLTPSRLPIPLNLLQAVSATDAGGLKRVFDLLALTLKSKAPIAEFSDFISAVVQFEKRNVNNQIQKVYDRSADLQHDLPDLIAKSTSEIILCGVHFNISLMERRPDYIAALCRGVTMRVAVLDPESEAVATTAATYGMEKEELLAECRQSTVVIRGFQAAYLKAKESHPNIGSFKVYQFARLPRARFYLFDTLLSEGSLVCTPYVDVLNSSQTPSYKFRADAPPAIRYKEACMELMKQAVELV